MESINVIMPLNAFEKMQKKVKEKSDIKVELAVHFIRDYPYNYPFCNSAFKIAILPHQRNDQILDFAKIQEVGEAFEKSLNEMHQKHKEVEKKLATIKTKWYYRWFGKKSKLQKELKDLLDCYRI